MADADGSLGLEAGSGTEPGDTNAFVGFELLALIAFVVLGLGAVLASCYRCPAPRDMQLCIRRCTCMHAMSAWHVCNAQRTSMYGIHQQAGGKGKALVPMHARLLSCCPASTVCSHCTVKRSCSAKAQPHASLTRQQRVLCARAGAGPGMGND